MKKSVKLILSLSCLTITGALGVAGAFLTKGEKAQASLAEVQTFAEAGITDADSNGLYDIDTAEKLVKVAEQISLEGNSNWKAANYELTDDIDLSGKLWTPIGTATNPFAGAFTGNSHTVSGITQLNSSVVGGTYFGLFGYISGAQLADFVIVNEFSFSSNPDAVRGNLVGYATNSIISNVYDLSVIDLKTIGQIAGTSYVYKGGAHLSGEMTVDGSITIGTGTPTGTGFVVNFDKNDNTEGANARIVKGSENLNDSYKLITGGLSITLTNIPSKIPTYGTSYPKPITVDSTIEAKRDDSYAFTQWNVGDTTTEFTEVSQAALATNNYVVNAAWEQVEYTLNVRVSGELSYVVNNSHSLSVISYNSTSGIVTVSYAVSGTGIVYTGDIHRDDLIGTSGTVNLKSGKTAVLTTTNPVIKQIGAYAMNETTWGDVIGAIAALNSGFDLLSVHTDIDGNSTVEQRYGAVTVTYDASGNKKINGISTNAGYLDAAVTDGAGTGVNLGMIPKEESGTDAGKRIVDVYTTWQAQNVNVSVAFDLSNGALASDITDLALAYTNSDPITLSADKKATVTAARGFGISFTVPYGFSARIKVNNTYVGSQVSASTQATVISRTITDGVASTSTITIELSRIEYTVSVTETNNTTNIQSLAIRNTSTRQQAANTPWTTISGSTITTYVGDSFIIDITMNDGFEATGVTLSGVTGTATLNNSAVSVSGLIFGNNPVIQIATRSKSFNATISYVIDGGDYANPQTKPEVTISTNGGTVASSTTSFTELSTGDGTGSISVSDNAYYTVTGVEFNNSDCGSVNPYSYSGAAPGANAIKILLSKRAYTASVALKGAHTSGSSFNTTVKNAAGTSVAVDQTMAMVGVQVGSAKTPAAATDQTNFVYNNDIYLSINVVSDYYKFDGWYYSNGTLISTSSNYTISAVATGNKEIYASISEKTVNITINSNVLLQDANYGLVRQSDYTTTGAISTINTSKTSLATTITSVKVGGTAGTTVTYTLGQDSISKITYSYNDSNCGTFIGWAYKNSSNQYVKLGTSTNPETINGLLGNRTNDAFNSLFASGTLEVYPLFSQKIKDAKIFEDYSKIELTAGDYVKIKSGSGASTTIKLQVNSIEYTAVVDASSVLESVTGSDNWYKIKSGQTVTLTKANPSSVDYYYFVATRPQSTIPTSQSNNYLVASKHIYSHSNGTRTGDINRESLISYASSASTVIDIYPVHTLKPYTIKYYKESAKTNQIGTDQTVKFGQPYTVRDASGIDGYYVTEWTTDGSDTITTGWHGTEWTNTSNKDYYIKTQEGNEFTDVKISVNGGIYNSSNADISLSIGYGDDIIAALSSYKTAITRSGYNIAGWVLFNNTKSTSYSYGFGFGTDDLSSYNGNTFGKYINGSSVPFTNVKFSGTGEISYGGNEEIRIYPVWSLTANTAQKVNYTASDYTSANKSGVAIENATVADSALTSITLRITNFAKQNYINILTTGNNSISGVSFTTTLQKKNGGSWTNVGTASAIVSGGKLGYQLPINSASDAGTYRVILNVIDNDKVFKDQTTRTFTTNEFDVVVNKTILDITSNDGTSNRTATRLTDSILWADEIVAEAIHYIDIVAPYFKENSSLDGDNVFGNYNTSSTTLEKVNYILGKFSAGSTASISTITDVQLKVIEYLGFKAITTLGLANPKVKSDFESLIGDSVLPTSLDNLTTKALYDANFGSQRDVVRTLLSSNAIVQTSNLNSTWRSTIPGVRFEKIVAANGVNGSAFDGAHNLTKTGTFNTYWKLSFSEDDFKSYMNFTSAQLTEFLNGQTLQAYILANVDQSKLISISSGDFAGTYIVNTETLGTKIKSESIDKAIVDGSTFMVEIQDNYDFAGSAPVEFSQNITGVTGATSVDLVVKTSAGTAGEYSILAGNLSIERFRVNVDSTHFYTVVRSGNSFVVDTTSGTYNGYNATSLAAIDPNKYTFVVTNSVNLVAIASQESITVKGISASNFDIDLESTIYSGVYVTITKVYLQNDTTGITVNGSNGIYSNGTFVGKVIANGTNGPVLRFTSAVKHFDYTITSIPANYSFIGLQPLNASAATIKGVLNSLAGAVTPIKTAVSTTTNKSTGAYISKAVAVELVSNYTAPDNSAVNESKIVYVNLNQETDLTSQLTFTRAGWHIASITPSVANNKKINISSVAKLTAIVNWTPDTDLGVTLSQSEQRAFTAQEGVNNVSASNYVESVTGFNDSQFTAKWVVSGELVNTIDLSKVSQAGTYTLRVKLNDYNISKDLSVTFTVSARTLDIASVSGNANLVYSNSDKYSGVTFTYSGAEGAGYPTYSATGVTKTLYTDSALTSTASEAKNVGTYYIKVTVNSDVYAYNTSSSYYNSTKEAYVVTFSIAKDSHVISQAEVVTASKVYGANDPTLQASFTQNGENITIGLERVSGEIVGDYVLSIKSNGIPSAINANYDITIASGVHFSIVDLADKTLYISAKSGVTFANDYNGKKITSITTVYNNGFFLSFNYEGGTSLTKQVDVKFNTGAQASPSLVNLTKDAQSIWSNTTFSFGANVEPKDANAYSFSGSSLGTFTSVRISNAETANFIIGKVTLGTNGDLGKIEEYTRTYGDVPASFTKVYSTGVGSETIDIVFTNSNTNARDAVYTLSVSNPVYTNYIVTSATASLKINKKVLGTNGDLGKIEEYTATYGAVPAIFTKVYSTGVGSETIDIVFTNSNTNARDAVYTLSVSNPTYDNYTVISATATLKINKAVYTIGLNNGAIVVKQSGVVKATLSSSETLFRKQYGDSDPALTKAVTLNGDALTLTFARVAGEVIGTYNISGVSISDTTNYNVSIEEASSSNTWFEIARREGNLLIILDDGQNLTTTYNNTNSVISAAIGTGVNAGKLVLTVTAGSASDTATASLYYINSQSVKTAIANGLSDMLSANSTIVFSFNETPHNAGNYTVSVSKSGTYANDYFTSVAFANSTGTTISSVPYTITKDTAIATVNSTTKVYGQNDETAYTATISKNSETKTLYLTRVDGEIAGTYAFTVDTTRGDYTYVSNNYNYSLSSDNFTITAPTTATLKVELVDSLTAVYNGKEIISITKAYEESKFYLVFNYEGNTSISKEVSVKYNNGTQYVTLTKAQELIWTSTDFGFAFTAAEVKDYVSGGYAFTATITGTGDKVENTFTSVDMTGLTSFTITKDSHQIVVGDINSNILTKVYGEDDPTFVASFTQNGENITIGLERINRSEEVGLYELSIAANGIPAAVANNYNITIASGINFTIEALTDRNLYVTTSALNALYNRKAITAVAAVYENNTTKLRFTYEDNSTFDKVVEVKYHNNSGNYVALQKDVSSIWTASTFSFGSNVEPKNAGSYALSGNISGTFTGIKIDGANSKDFEITKVALGSLVNIASETATYGSVESQYTISYSATTISGDSIDIEFNNLNVNAGEYTLTEENLSFTNYTVASATMTLTINKLSLGNIGKIATKIETYGNVPESYTVVYTETTVENEAIEIVFTNSNTNAGSYTLTATNVELTNYTVARATVALTINKAAYTISTVNSTIVITQTNGTNSQTVNSTYLISKVYGASEPALAYTFTLINDDSVTVTFTSREAGETVGSYKLTGISSVSNANYDISIATADQADNNWFEITNLANTTLYVEVSDFTAFTSVYANKKINKTLLTSYESSKWYIIVEDVDETQKAKVEVAPKYFNESALVAITADITTILDSTNFTFEINESGDVIDVGDQYQIIGTSAGGQFSSVAFVTTTGSEQNLYYSITSYNLGAVSESYSKTYGDSDPTFTKVVTGVNSESVTLTYARSEAGENAGTHALTLLSISSNNYVATGASATLTINKFNLDLSGETYTFNRVYGEADGTFTEEVDGVNSEKLTLTFVRAAGQTGTDVGSYNLELTSWTRDNNYDVTASATLTIDKAAYTISTVNSTIVITQTNGTNSQTVNSTYLISKVYGASEPALAYTFTLINDDSVTVTFTSREAGETVGSYKLTGISSVSNANYDISIATADQADNNWFEIIALHNKNLYVTILDSLTANYNGQTITTVTPVYVGGVAKLRFTYSNSSVTDRAVSLSYFDNDNNVQSLTKAVETIWTSATFAITANAKNVGTYAVTGSISGTFTAVKLDNADSAVFEITEYVYELTSVDLDKTFGDADPALEVVITSVTATGEQIKITFTRDTSAIDESYELVGSYTLTLDKVYVYETGAYEETNNYTISYNTSNEWFEIEAPTTATLKVDLVDTLANVYNGKEITSITKAYEESKFYLVFNYEDGTSISKEVSIKYHNGTEYVALSVAQELIWTSTDFGFAFIAAEVKGYVNGGYAFTATITGTGDKVENTFTSVDISNLGKFVINRYELDLTSESIEFNADYANQVKVWDTNYSTGVNNESINLRFATTAEVSEVGNYTLNFDSVTDSDNYAVVNAEATLHVNKLDASLLVVVDATFKAGFKATYNGLTAENVVVAEWANHDGIGDSEWYLTVYYKDSNNDRVIAQTKHYKLGDLKYYQGGVLKTVDAGLSTMLNGFTFAFVENAVKDVDTYNISASGENATFSGIKFLDGENQLTQIQFAIEKDTVVITSAGINESLEKRYGESDNGLFTYTLDKNGDEFTINLVRETGENVGSYDLSIVEDSNYSEATQNYAISLASADNDWFEITELTDKNLYVVLDNELTHYFDGTTASEPTITKVGDGWVLTVREGVSTTLSLYYNAGAILDGSAYYVTANELIEVSNVYEQLMSGLTVAMSDARSVGEYPIGISGSASTTFNGIRIAYRDNDVVECKYIVSGIAYTLVDVALGKRFASSDPALYIERNVVETGEKIKITFTREAGEEVGNYTLTVDKVYAYDSVNEIYNETSDYVISYNTSNKWFTISELEDSTLYIVLDGAFGYVYNGEVATIIETVYNNGWKLVAKANQVVLAETNVSLYYNINEKPQGKTLVANLTPVEQEILENLLTNFTFGVVDASKNVGVYELEIDGYTTTFGSAEFAFESLDDEASLVIAQKDIIISVERGFDGTDVINSTNSTVTYTTAVAGDDLVFSGVIESDDEVGSIAVSSYELTGNDANNYNVTSVTANITKNTTWASGIEVSVQNFVYGDIVYDENRTEAEWYELLLNDLSITSGAIDLKPYISGSVTVSGDAYSTAGKLKAGTYTATVVFESDVIEGFAVSGYEFNITVTPKEVEIAIEGVGTVDKPYDGTQDLNVDAVVNDTGIIDGDIVTYKVQYASAEVATNVQFEIVNIAGADKDNYLLVLAEGSRQGDIYSRSYVIVFDHSSNSFVDDGELINGVEYVTINYVPNITAEEAINILPTQANMTRKGYEFAAWYIDQALTKVISTEEGSEGNILDFLSAHSRDTDDVKIYSKWNRNTYMVSLETADENGSVDLSRGSYLLKINSEDQPSASTYTINYYDKVELLVDEGANFVFVGAVTTSETLSEGNKEFVVSQHLDKDYVISLRFRDVNVGLKIISDGVTTTTSRDFGTIKSMNAFEFITFGLIKLGHHVDKVTFEDINGETQEVESTSTIAAVISAITGDEIDDDEEFVFEIDWVANTYDIEFHGNYPDETDNVNSIAVTYGTRIGDSEGYTEVSFNGYRFLGWSEDRNAAIGSINEETIFNWDENKTLYAIWHIEDFDTTIVVNNTFSSALNNFTVEVEDNGIWQRVDAKDGTVNVYKFNSNNNYRIVANPGLGYYVEYAYDSECITLEQDGNSAYIENTREESTITINIQARENTFNIAVSNISKFYKGGVEVEIVNGNVTFTSATESEVIITAIAAAGYKMSASAYSPRDYEEGSFASAHSDSYLRIYNFNKDISFTLNAEPESYKVTVIKDDKTNLKVLNGQEIEGDKITVSTGTPLELEVTPTYGYENQSVTVTTGVAEVAQDGNLFTVTDFTAAFEITITATSIKYAVTVGAVSVDENDIQVNGTENSVSLSQGGSSVSVADYLSEIKYEAEATNGYSFKGWYSGVIIEDELVVSYGTLISNESTYIHTVDGETILTAIFKYTLYDVNISVKSKGLIDMVVGNSQAVEEISEQTGRYYHNENFRLTPKASKGYSFVNWTDENNNPIIDSETFVIEEGGVLVITLNKDVNVVANFEANEGSFIAKSELYINGTLMENQDGEFAKIAFGLFDDTKASVAEKFTPSGIAEAVKEVPFATDSDVYIRVETYQGYEFGGLLSKTISGKSVVVSDEILHYTIGSTTYYVFKISGLNSANDYEDLIARINAIEIRLTLNFINEGGNIVDAGRIEVVDGFGIFYDGNYSSIVHVVAVTGSIVAVKAYTRFGFMVASDPIVAEDGSIGDLETGDVQDSAYTGFTSYVNFKISEFSDEIEVSVRIVSESYSLELDDGNGNVIATIQNIKPGDPILISEDQRVALRDLSQSKEGYEVAGFYTAQEGSGIKYIDSDLQVLMPWNEYGYKWTGTEYIAANNYNPDTKTFKLYAGWERLKTAITIIATPTGIESIDPTVAAKKVITSLNNTNSWLDINNDFYADILYGADIIIRAPVYDNYQFNKWYIYLDGELREQKTDEVFVVRGGFNCREVVILALYKTKVELLDSVGGSARLVQESVEITSGNTGNLDSTKSFTLTAIPDKGFKFVAWINAETGEVISDLSTYTFEASEDNQFLSMKIRAEFTGDIVTIILGNYDQQYGRIDRIVYNEENQSTSFVAAVGKEIELWTSLKQDEAKKYGVTWNLKSISFDRKEYGLNNTEYLVYKYLILGEDMTDDNKITITPNFTEETITVSFDITLEGNTDYRVAAYVRVENMLNGRVEISHGQPLDVIIELNENYKINIAELNGISVISRFNKEKNVLAIKSSDFVTYEEINEFTLRIEFRRDLWIESIFASRLEGEGTERDPYSIYDAKDLAFIAYKINVENNSDYANAFYKLKNDVSLFGKFWTPIGTEENPFNGTLTLEGFKIFGITLDPEVDEEETNYNGVFGVIGENARFVEARNAIVIIIIGVSGAVVLIGTGLLIFFLVRRRKKKNVEKLANS